MKCVDCTKKFIDFGKNHMGYCINCARLAYLAEKKRIWAAERDIYGDTNDNK